MFWIVVLEDDEVMEYFLSVLDFEHHEYRCLLRNEPVFHADRQKSPPEDPWDMMAVVQQCEGDGNDHRWFSQEEWITMGNSIQRVWFHKLERTSNIRSVIDCWDILFHQDFTDHILSGVSPALLRDRNFVRI